MAIACAIAAALNNAEWCAAVWASHGLVVERSVGSWFTRSPAPPFYPNLVTVDPLGDVASQTSHIVALAEGSASFAVKDSFARLPLGQAGFRSLFEATWLRRAVPKTFKKAEGWRRVTDANDLERWESAWRAGSDTPAGLFKPALLADPRVIVVGAADSKGSFVAGAIGYEAAGVVGITNSFGNDEDAILAVTAHMSGSIVVCYERGAKLRDAERRGFEPRGSLTVWVMDQPAD